MMEQNIWDKPISHGEILKKIWKHLDLDYLGCNTKVSFVAIITACLLNGKTGVTPLLQNSN